MKGNDLILTGGGEWRASGGRDRGTRGGVIDIVATVRERWLWPDEAAMLGPLAVRGGAGRVGGVCVSDPGGGVSRIREKHPSGRGEAVRETWRRRQYLCGFHPCSLTCPV